MVLRRTIALLCVLTFGVLVQASAVCHVVTCSLPDDPPKCHHEAPETPSPETCKEFAAAAAWISLDITLTPAQALPVEAQFAVFPPARIATLTSSPPPQFAVLRI